MAHADGAGMPGIPDSTLAAAGPSDENNVADVVMGDAEADAGPPNPEPGCVEGGAGGEVRVP